MIQLRMIDNIVINKNHRKTYTEHTPPDTNK